ncbi:MAG TPA: tRNA uridine-5-carboxymethylaminomethyl(34) synthesis GTPase MnmE [Bacteroidetes bacterium]|nr:tRNA uridine-5-carboxymethylaminomethyl(34) synthesis GTPase MnmE [Bacteroidota bacterium]
MNQFSHDTIAAIATPIGIGGISVIRISGSESFTIVNSVFKGTTNLIDAASHTIHYGNIMDPDGVSIIDTVLVSVFHNPNSYTGEDIIEISSHGGYFVTQKILSLLHSGGARPAKPGEFTQRAFLNGKLDLTQAEAVADIIHSRTEKSHKASVMQLSGRLSKHVNIIRDQLLNLCSLLELELDFSQEGIELTTKDDVLKRLASIEREIKKLADSYSSGKFVREGVRVALIGKPNAGKSSLLNILLGEERAIVSEIAGTTRDVIEESIILNGLEFVFFDTAGLRESYDTIEQEGIRRTLNSLKQADIALFIIDSSFGFSQGDVLMFKQITESAGSQIPFLICVNKTDIKDKEFSLLDLGIVHSVEISCKLNLGIEKLKKNLLELSIPNHDSNSSSIVITNIRHKEALISALKSLQKAKETITNGLGGDFAAIDLRDALNYLGEIIGLTTPDDILNHIFGKFCIGK